MITAIDIGGTTIKAALFKKGKIVDRMSFKAGTKKENKASLQTIINNYNTKTIGIGCPGPFLRKGKTGHLSNLDLSYVDLPNLFKKRNVYVENDANCHALAESLRGAGKDKRIVLSLTLGSGLGTGLVINNKIYRGRLNALEFGTAKPFKDDIETEYSKQYFLNKYGKEPVEIKDKAIWEEYGKKLAYPVSTLIQIFDPEVVIIGGNIANSYKKFSKPLKTEVKKICSFKPCPIKKAKIKDSGITGAFLITQK